MGEGTNRVGLDAPAPAEQLEHEMEDIRANLTGIVKELDRRWHNLFDWRLQLRQHRPAMDIAAVGVVLLVGVAVMIIIVRKRGRRRPKTIRHRLSEALGRIIGETENLGWPVPGIGSKALASAACGAAGILAKSLAQSLVSSRPPSRRAFVPSPHGRLEAREA